MRSYFLPLASGGLVVSARLLAGGRLRVAGLGAAVFAGWGAGLGE